MDSIDKLNRSELVSFCKMVKTKIEKLEEQYDKLQKMYWDLLLANDAITTREEKEEK